MQFSISNHKKIICNVREKCRPYRRRKMMFFSQHCLNFVEKKIMTYFEFGYKNVKIYMMVSSPVLSYNNHMLDVDLTLCQRLAPLAQRWINVSFPRGIYINWYWVHECTDWLIESISWHAVKKRDLYKETSCLLMMACLHSNQYIRRN